MPIPELAPHLLEAAQKRFEALPDTEELTTPGLDSNRVIHIASLLGAAVYDVLKKETGQTPDISPLDRIVRVLRKKKANQEIESQRIKTANRLNEPIH